MRQDKACGNQASRTRGTVSLWTPYKVIQQREKRQELIRKQVSTSDQVSALSAAALFKGGRAPEPTPPEQADTYCSIYTPVNGGEEEKKK